MGQAETAWDFAALKAKEIRFFNEGALAQKDAQSAQNVLVRQKGKGNASADRAFTID